MQRQSGFTLIELMVTVASRDPGGDFDSFLYDLITRSKIARSDLHLLAMRPRWSCTFRTTVLHRRVRTR